MKLSEFKKLKVGDRFTYIGEGPDHLVWVMVLKLDNEEEKISFMYWIERKRCEIRTEDYSSFVDRVLYENHECKERETKRCAEFDEIIWSYAKEMGR